MNDAGFVAVQSDGSLRSQGVKDNIVSPDNEAFRSVHSTSNTFSAVTEHNQSVSLGLSGADRKHFNISSDGSIAYKDTAEARKMYSLTLMNKNDSKESIISFQVFMLTLAELRSSGIGSGSSLSGFDSALFDTQGKLKPESADKDHYQLFRDGKPLVVFSDFGNADTPAVPREIVEEWKGTSIPGYKVYALAQESSAEWKMVKYSERNLEVKTLVSGSGMPSSVIASRSEFAAVMPDRLVQSGSTYTREYGDAVYWSGTEAQTLLSDATVKKAVIGGPKGFLVVDPRTEGVGKPLKWRIGNAMDSIESSTPAVKVAASNTHFGTLDARGKVNF